MTRSIKPFASLCFETRLDFISAPSSALGAPSEKIWNPPLSVMSGDARFMKAWRPPAFSIASIPGWSIRWYVLQNIRSKPAFSNDEV